MNNLIHYKIYSTNPSNICKTVPSPKKPDAKRNAKETKLSDDCHKMNIKYIPPAVNESTKQGSYS